MLTGHKLIDWQTARAVGKRVAGEGTVTSAVERAAVAQEFAEIVPEAEGMVEGFTGLSPGSYRSQPFVMSRSQWLDANLRGFETVLEPFAAKALDKRDGQLSALRRQVVGAEVGALVGYLSRRVLGQYDLFLAPEDEGTVYFVGANIVAAERKYGFAPRDFRLWISLHEVAHRLQFGGVPWLRGYLAGLFDSYLATVELDPKQLLQTLKRAVQEARKGQVEWRGVGWIFLLMTPEQRQIFSRMQALMSLLEGHGNFVMNSLAKDRIPGAALFKRRLQERRQSQGIERTIQKAIGLDVKTQQYDLGERFISLVVNRAGMRTFDLVWQSPANLPSLEEIGRPERWLARMNAA